MYQFIMFLNSVTPFRVLHFFASLFLHLLLLFFGCDPRVVSRNQKRVMIVIYT
ncbi:hypothetical protein HanPSC8_Chr11g0484871 [Helianthus annuus]|nr:hypothetical protein HanPSC8_Chr11g0484871 [Helianthus annuus]